MSTLHFRDVLVDWLKCRVRNTLKKKAIIILRTLNDQYINQYIINVRNYEDNTYSISCNRQSPMYENS